MDPKAPRRVLVINTDQSVLLVVHDLLQEAGYSVSLLSYHDHDLDEVKQLAPDVIVLDDKWAGHDNGWSMLQLFRLDPKTVSIPIVLCTGAAREVDALRDHLVTLGVTAALADASTWSDAHSVPTGNPCDREGYWTRRR